MLAAAGAVPWDSLHGLGLVGELALDGRIRPVRGALAQTLALANAGLFFEQQLQLEQALACFREARALDDALDRIHGRFGEVAIHRGTDR